MKDVPYKKTYLPREAAWLRAIPENWQQTRGRFLMAVNPSARRARELGEADEVSFVPMEAVGEYGGLKLERTKPVDEIGSGYTAFEDGDVLVAKITPCFENGKGALAQGLRNGVGFGTTELHVLRAGSRLDKQFLFYLTISHAFRALGESEMYGAGGQKRVPPEFVKDFRVPLPPIEEQQTIARFLDAKTAQIDALVEKKRQLIDKLKEKRRALISRTVTRGLPPEAAKAAGLEPNPEMTDSSVEWIGNVPAHWKVVRLGREIELQRGVDITKDEQNEGTVPVVSSGGVASFHDRPIARAPGVVVGRKGTAGAVHYIEQDFWPHDTTLWVRNFCSNIPRYVYYKLLSLDLASFDTGTANPTVNRNLVHPVLVSWPPVQEQTAIVGFLDQVMGEVDRLLVGIESAIDRLQEYRGALITATVTGQIDVRESV